MPAPAHTSPDDLIKLLVSGLFALIIAASFIKLIIFGDEKELLKKVIGGIAVLLVAVVAANGWIFFVAFLIGGLLIASENFMFFLTAALRSDSKEVHKLAPYWKPLSTADIALKQTSDALEISNEVSAPVQEDAAAKQVIDPDNASGSSDRARNRAVRIKELLVKQSEKAAEWVEKVRRIERAVLHEVQIRNVHMQQHLKKYVEIRNGQSRVSYDAAIVEENTNRIVCAIEIKVARRMTAKYVEDYLMNVAPNYVSDNYPTVFLFVFDNYNHSEAEEILRLREKFVEEHQGDGVQIYHYSDLRLEAVYDKDLRRINPNPLLSSIFKTG